MKRITFLLAAALAIALALEAGAEVKCSGTPCIDSAGGVTSPISVDPMSATGVWTFDNAANTPVTAADGVIDSTLTAGRVTFAGTSGRLSDDADLTFATDTLTAAKVSVSSTGADALVLASTTSKALRLGDATNPYLASYVNGITGGISLGRNSVASTGLIYADNTYLTVSNTGGQLRLIASTGRGPALTSLALTGSTMTNGTGQGPELRTGTSYFDWTNAMVAALAGTAGDINVVTLPAKTQLLDALVVITGAATGPATVTVSCGDAIGGTPFTNLVAVADAKAAANTVYGDAVAERGASIDTEFWYLPSYTATTLVTCHFISTGADLSTVTGSTGRVILTTRALP